MRHLATRVGLLSVMVFGCGGSPDPEDAGAVDAQAVDAASVDGGVDAEIPRDAGPPDGGETDTGEQDAGPADTGPQDAGPQDAGPADTGPLDAGPRCTMGSEAPIGQLCVTSGSGGAVAFQVVPEGCRSSSCTIRHVTTCDVVRVDGDQLELDALFCLEGTGDLICTSDCNGGGFANCGADGLPDGEYTARLGSLEVSFTLPLESEVCDGSPF